jgi:signal peptidase I
MEPAFYRGDLLFLTNPPYERYHTGDITVYKVPGAEIPIVHRVLETHDVAMYVGYSILVEVG